jgi:predicted RNA-binding protein YlqC (UPF0109 family)
MGNEVQDILESIIKALVNKPEEVKIEKKVDEIGVLLLVKVADEDAGFVIGKQGRIVQAIRTIISAIGIRNRSKISIRLDVPEGPPNREGTERRPFRRKFGEGDSEDLKF